MGQGFTGADGFNNTEVPFVAGARRGYRGWRIALVKPAPDDKSLILGWNSGWKEAAERPRDIFEYEPVLASVSYQYVWHNGINISECNAHRPVSPKCDYPSNRCSCGFYAYHDEQYWNGGTSSVPFMYGVIEAYGRMVIGTKGFRAGKAIITGLAGPVHWPKPWQKNLDTPLRRDLDEYLGAKLREKYDGVWFASSERELLKNFPLPGFGTGLA